MQLEPKQSHFLLVEIAFPVFTGIGMTKEGTGFLLAQE